MSDLQLISENAIETRKNCKTISLSLLEFFRACCFNGALVTPDEMKYNIEQARLESGCSEDDDKTPAREIYRITFSESPNLYLIKENEVERITKTETKEITDLTRRERWAKRFGKVYIYNLDVFVRYKIKSSEYYLQHDDLNMRLTEQQFQKLAQFFC